MTMNKRYLIALFLCAACALSGCGGEQPPDAYSAAEDSLPSLTALVSPAGDPQCTEQTEDGAVSYCSTGLDNTVQAVTDYRQAGIPMSRGFAELGERSEIDDIVSFAAIYKTIEGKTSDFGYIISQTRDIIKDKSEITMEIETSITSAKSETYMMLVLPLVLVVVMSVMGSGFLDSLFTTALGRGAATVGVICTFVSYVLASRAAEIQV